MRDAILILALVGSGVLVWLATKNPFLGGAAACAVYALMPEKP